MVKRNRLKITIETLDNTLFILKEVSVFGSLNYSFPKYSETENELFIRACNKLEKDGFVYSKTTSAVNKTTSKFNNTVKRYFISMDGLLALETAPLYWRNKPYRYSKFKESLNTTWTVTKTVAVIVNAVVILIFTYLTYIKN